MATTTLRVTTKDKADIAEMVARILIERGIIGKDTCDYTEASEILERSKDWLSRNKWIPRTGRGKQTRFKRSLMYRIKENGYMLPD